MEKHDRTGRWIATQLESAILNTVARITRVKAQRKRRGKVPASKPVRPVYDELVKRELASKWARDWAGGQFDHDDHLSRIALASGLKISGLQPKA